MSALEDTEKKLAQLEDERVKREQAIERILGLLDQANEKRQSEPENRKYYNDLLGRLETALDEAKANLAECHKLIDRVTARRDRLREREIKQGDEGEAPPAEETEAQERPSAPASDAPDESAVADTGEGNPERLLQAARLVAATPIESVGAVTLEDVAFAQAYLTQRAEAGELTNFDHQVAVRVALAAELGGDSADSTVEGRRKQADLREAIDKLEKQRFHEISLGEMNLVLNCYAVLSRKLSPSQNDARVLTVLDSSLRTLQDQCQRVLRKLIQIKEQG